MAARVAVLLMVGVGSLLLVAGCGGDDEADSDAGSPGASIKTSSLSKEQFIEKATSVCQQTRKNLLNEVDAYLDKHENDGSQAVVFANMVKGVLLPKVEAEIAAIRGLGAPEGDEETVESMLAAQTAAVNDVRRRKRVKSAQDLEDSFAAAGKEFENYGLSACANA